jgi:hypothetical protein
MQSLGKSGSINSQTRCKNLSLDSIESGGVRLATNRVARFMVQLRFFAVDVCVLAQIMYRWSDAKIARWKLAEH